MRTNTARSPSPLQPSDLPYLSDRYPSQDISGVESDGAEEATPPTRWRCRSRGRGRDRGTHRVIAVAAHLVVAHSRTSAPNIVISLIYGDTSADIEDDTRSGAAEMSESELELDEEEQLDDGEEAP
jgi:hypothetical protein